MKTISVRELHERTGAWVRRAVELGAITVTDRGRPVVRIEAIVDIERANRFKARALRPGYARLKGTLGGGTDSSIIVSDDREHRSDTRER